MNNAVVLRGAQMRKPVDKPSRILVVGVFVVVDVDAMHGISNQPRPPAWARSVLVLCGPGASTHELFICESVDEVANLVDARSSS